MVPDEVTISVEPGSHTDSEAREILRNLQVLYGTRTGEQGLNRDFGIDWEALDYPTESAKALLTAEYVRKTAHYVPRARVERVQWEHTEQDGLLRPKVVVSIGGNQTA